jgi:cellulose biosynthesis protein BcsQ
LSRRGSASIVTSNSGVGATLLKRRLEAVSKIFQVCIIDAPPQRSQICLTVIGAADFLIIPAEASVKGYGSLVRSRLLPLVSAMLYLPQSPG